MLACRFSSPELSSYHSPVLLSAPALTRLKPPLLFISHLRCPLINTLLSFRIQCLIKVHSACSNIAFVTSAVGPLLPSLDRLIIGCLSFASRRRQALVIGPCQRGRLQVLCETEDASAAGGEFQQASALAQVFVPPQVYASPITQWHVEVDVKQVKRVQCNPLSTQGNVQG